MPFGKKTAKQSYRVLITGATTTIGRKTIDKLYAHKDVKLIIGTAGDKKPYYFSELNTSKFIYKKINILDYREMSGLFISEEFKKARINSIIHLGKRCDPFRYSQRVHDMNVTGLRNLIDRSSEEHLVKKFVYLSTSTVYNLKGNIELSIPEDYDLNLSSFAHPVVRDSVDSEIICRKRMESSDLKIVVIRPSGILGRNVKSELNELLLSPIFFTPMGFDPMVHPVHADDVIDSIVSGLKTNKEGIFNIAGKKAIPLSSLLKANGTYNVKVPSALVEPMNKLLKKLKITRYDVSVNPDRLFYNSVFDTTKATQELGYKPKHHVKFYKNPFGKDSI